MAVLLLPQDPLPVIVTVLVVLITLRKIHLDFTTMACRRRMIRDNGCEEPYAYPHKGIFGKLYGWDVTQELMKSARQGCLHEQARIRNFSRGRMTLTVKGVRGKVIHTIEPENVKIILATKFTDYNLSIRRKEAFIPVFGHGIFSTDGAAWERSRGLIRPNFTRAQVADLHMFERHMVHLINAIPRDGSTIELQDLFFGLTMDSATEFLFGRSTKTLASGLDNTTASNFVKAFIYVTEQISKVSASGGLKRWIPDATWHQSVKVIHQFADEIIKDAIQEKNSGSLSDNKRYVFLYALLEQTQEPVALRSELLNILLAGRDTTAGLLSNTWHVLSKRPDIWTKLKAEVDQLGGEPPYYATIKGLKYLRYLLNESLRLMPVVPANSRTAVRDTILPLGGGPDGKSPVLVTKGTTVSYSIWSMHRREDFYGPDALDFKPERWEFLRPGWEYLPFNGGPRACVGQQYALIEASYATVRLMQTFARIESRDQREWREWLAITLASGVGCKVGLFEK